MREVSTTYFSFPLMLALAWGSRVGTHREKKQREKRPEPAELYFTTRMEDFLFSPGATIDPSPLWENGRRKKKKNKKKNEGLRFDAAVGALFAPRRPCHTLYNTFFVVNLVTRNKSNFVFFFAGCNTFVVNLHSKPNDTSFFMTYYFLTGFQDTRKLTRLARDLLNSEGKNKQKVAFYLWRKKQ